MADIPAAGRNRRLRVFLCHSAKDKPAVRRLYVRLRDDGYDPWLDEEDLLPGQDWRVEIERAVKAADCMIVCLSRAAAGSAGFTSNEIAFALAAHGDSAAAGALIPLLLEPCDVPEALRRYHWVDYRDPRGHERLVRGLSTRASALGLG